MSQPLNNADAIKYCQFVNAAYQMFAADNGNLTPAPQGIPAGWNMVAWIQMSDFALGAVEPKFYGFIAQSSVATNEFILAIRGTGNWIEWWDDAHCLSVPFDKVPNSGHVAKGFDSIYSTLKVVERTTSVSADLVARPTARIVGTFADQVGQILKSRQMLALTEKSTPSAPSFVVAGHSLGAALCTLYVIENASKKVIENPRICTFASPRVGNAQFAQTFNALGLTSWRIVNAPDLVPNLPPDIFGYVHVDALSLFDSTGKVKSSLGCAHDLATYMALLDPTLAPSAGCVPQPEEATMRLTQLPARKGGHSYTASIGTDLVAAASIQVPSDCIAITINVNRGVAEH